MIHASGSKKRLLACSFSSEEILAGWVGELAVPIYRGREVTGFAQDDTGVDVALHRLTH
jgi:hypothetical protein